MPESSLIATLRSFADAGVRFILVGGLAAVLNGAPIQTFDIDLVYAQDDTNIKRLLAVLESLDAIFRLQPERRLRPAASHLSARGHLNLLTRYGPVDLLATIGENLAFDDLLPHTTEMQIAEGVRISVLDLETIIAVKEQLAGTKDIAVLPILRQTLSEMKKRRGS